MKRILWILLGIAFLAGAYGVYLYNKPHAKMEKARVDEQVEAQALYAAFETDEAAANTRFLGKVVAVTGQVSEVTPTDDGGLKVTLSAGDFGVSCELDPLTQHARTSFTAGETVTFKGNCTGYNLSVQLARCVELK